MQVMEPKDPNVNATYSIDWSSILVPEARRGTLFEVGDIVRPPRHTGFYYQCTTAGLTGSNYPNWPLEANEEVRDGSVVWLTKNPNDTAALTVSSAIWSVPSPLALVSQAENDTQTEVTISGGVDQKDYELLCRMTPSAGAAIEQTIVVPVRQQ